MEFKNLIGRSTFGCVVRVEKEKTISFLNDVSCELKKEFGELLVMDSPTVVNRDDDKVDIVLRVHNMPHRKGRRAQEIIEKLAKK